MANKNIIVNLVNPSAISNTIRYARIDNTTTPTYTTISNVTANPYIIQNVPNGQYSIGVTPNYGDGRICPEVFQTTPPCTGINAFSAIVSSTNFVISYSVAIGLPNVRVNIQYPNGGTFSQVYPANGLNITIAQPSNVYGAYSITITPCCDTGSGFFGNPSAPIILNVTPPNNSTFTNSTSGTLTTVSLTSFNTATTLIFTAASILTTGVTHFYLPDGFYNSLVVQINTGTIASGSLVTGSGTYPGVVSGSNMITFSNVNVSGGIAITVS